ncbi:uncharacterized protein LOC144711642 [Wolffia australiana]
MKRADPRAKELPSSSDSSSSDSDDEGSGLKHSLKKVEVAKKRKGLVDYGALSRHGYRGGLSVLQVPPPRLSVNDGQTNWSWSNGQPETDKSVETYEDREHTRAAANSVMVATTALPPGGLRDGGLTFSQKEKRKRDLGQASRGKSYVEEEKRLLRERGVYSGFDS